MLKKRLLWIWVFICIIFIGYSMEKGVVYANVAKSDIKGSGIVNMSSKFTLKEDVRLRGIGIWDKRTKVESIYGKPKRKSINEYGIYWETYYLNNNYKDFLMVGYQRDVIVAMYTNQDIVKTMNGIRYGSLQIVVRKIYGSPLEYIDKGNTRYIMKDSTFDMYEMKGNYVTFFYDSFKGKSVDGVLVIKKELEINKKGFYGKPTTMLARAFEHQIYDLLNATRVKMGLPILKWDNRVGIVARNHSVDMVTKGYFNHVNKEGKNPADRFEKNRILYSVMGENIAYGQFGSIYVHYAWLNSKAHREVMLRKDFQYMGVGVSFNRLGVPYYTENFYTSTSK